MGGPVRDALIGRERPTPDYDFATDARPEAIEELLRPIGHGVVLVGARFGTVSAIVDDVECQVTTFRSDVYHPESRKPEVVFGDDIETDLSRRDFTVNAMALRLPDPRLVDPFDGAVDLAARRLRTPLSPDVSFTDDPLRMLRAARFIAGFGLEPDPELVAAVGEHRHRLEIVERRADPRRALQAARGRRSRARDSGSSPCTKLADEFLPELNAMQLEQDPIHHHKDVLAHTIAVVQKVSPDLVLRLAALMHDVGKPKTRSFDQGRASFHHHEVVGARITRERLHALRYSNEIVDNVTPARLPAPAHPHLRDGLDGQCGAPLRARRRPVARPAQRAPAL